MSVTHPLWLVLARRARRGAFVALRTSRRARGARGGAGVQRPRVLRARAGRRFDPALPLALACAAGIVLLGAALAGPRFIARVPVRGGAVVLCVDTSGSMRATDVEPSRAEAAAAAVRAFVDGVPDGTRLGIVAFSSGAGVVQPLSDDKDALREAIARIPPPNGGTAIGDALAAAARLLPPGGRRAIVLVTDGVNNLGSDPLAIARTVGAGGRRSTRSALARAAAGSSSPARRKRRASTRTRCARSPARPVAPTLAPAMPAACAAASPRWPTAPPARRSGSTPPCRSPSRAGLIVVIALAGGMLAGRFP